MTEKLICAAEMAHRLGVTTNTFYNWIKRGYAPPRVKGLGSAKRYWTTEAAFEEWCRLENPNEIQ